MLNKTFTAKLQEAPTKAGGPIWFGLVQFGILEPVVWLRSAVELMVIRFVARLWLGGMVRTCFP